jgi:hypothetical protein
MIKDVQKCHRAVYEKVQGSRRKVPALRYDNKLERVVSYNPQPIYPREKAHRLGGCVGLRKSLDDLKKGDNIYPLMGIEIRFSVF